MSCLASKMHFHCKKCKNIGLCLQEFGKAAKAVADEEKGSKIFTLSKTATDNFQLWEYGEQGTVVCGHWLATT